MYRLFIKRGLDIMLSALAVVVLSPVLLVLALLVRCKLGRPVLFRQMRIGRGNRPFAMFKFRTMTQETDEQGQLLPDEKRLTPFGKWLRSSSLDELPELFNILKGDMSIVGPRPLLPEYLPFYTQQELKRHKVRGGLVPPEVLYKNVTPSWAQQLAYEAEYAETVCFRLDVRILLMTIKGLFSRKELDYGGYVRQPFMEERRREQQILDGNSEVTANE